MDSKLSKSEKQEFSEWVFNNSKYYYRYGYLTYIIINSLFIFIDYYNYPDLFLQFLILRIFIGIPLLSIPVIITYLPRLRKNYLILVSLTSSAFPVMLVYMIMFIMKDNSVTMLIYFGGLILQMSIMGLAIYSWKQNIIFSTAIFTFYCISAYIQSNLNLFTDTFLVQSSIMIITAGVASVIASSLLGKVKYNSFITEKYLMKEKENEIQKNREIEYQKMKIQELNDSKDKFFSIIAHDLKSPIGSFQELTRLMADSYDTFTKEERIEFLNLLKDSSKNIYSLLKNLLDWSRSQMGVINFNPVEISVRSIVENAIELYKLAADGKQLILNNKVEEKLNIIADPNLILTVVRNLVSNAIKFTPQFGVVTIDAIDNKDSITVSVSDTGIGIPQNKIDELFRIDIIVPALGLSEERGTGLGLILCKEFVEKHGGKIWAESKAGDGTTLYFTLPKSVIE